MKQFLRLGDYYALTKHKQCICQQALCAINLGNARVAPFLSPPSLTPDPCPIPVISLYNPVKRPNTGILPGYARQTYGENAHSARKRMGHGSDWGDTGDRSGSASELKATSEPLCSSLNRIQANQDTTKSKLRSNQGVTNPPSPLQEYSVRRQGAKHPSTLRNSYEYGNTIVRWLFGLASTFSRNVVGGLLNTCRRNLEKSCVWTRAKAPARRGLGLALGMVALLCISMLPRVYGQVIGESETALEAAPDSVFLLKGSVKVRLTQKPLEGVRVALKGTDTVAFSDRNGDFSLAVTRRDGILEATYSGYQAVEKAYGDGRLPTAATSLSMEWTYSSKQHIEIGDSIPDALWDMPLSVANDAGGRSLVSLREYQSKRLVVLEFWAEYCKPCIETVDEWDGYSDTLKNGLQFFAVLIGRPENAEVFSQRRKWHSTNIVDEGAFRLNRSFFNRLVIGRLVWIKDGRLYAITDKRAYTPEQIRLLAEGENVPLRSATDWTYSTKN